MTSAPESPRRVTADDDAPASDPAETATVPPTDPAVDPEDAPADPDRPPADAVALLVAVVLPLVGVILALAGRTWLTIAIIMLTPLVLAAYGLGLWVFARVLRRGSLMRRVYGVVPRRYLGYAWVWAIAFLVAGASPMLGGLDVPWQAQVAAVIGASVVVGALTVSLWMRYSGDVNAPADDED